MNRIPSHLMRLGGKPGSIFSYFFQFLNNFDFLFKSLSVKVDKAKSNSDELAEKLQHISKHAHVEDEELKYSIIELQSINSNLMKKLASLEGKFESLKVHHEKHESSHNAEIGSIQKQIMANDKKLETAALEAAKKDVEVSKTRDQFDTAKLETGHSNSNSNLGMDTVLLIICANRPDYLKRTLDAIVKYHPRNSVPILISEDGNNPRVSENGYFKLARHFKWALDHVFDTTTSPISSSLPRTNRVIILEEDLEIAPDFFEMFAALAPMLDTDESLLAVSAWNDNGLSSLVKDASQLYRSDFFPGLGWMMTRKLWVQELSSKWPRAYWDDWLREPAQRKNRQILRPEVCRTFHFGERGVSNSQYSEYLNSIKLNTEFVKFTELDLKYLQKDNWDEEYVNHVKSLPITNRHQYKCTGMGGSKE
eukprot:gene10838-22620_t